MVIGEAAVAIILPFELGGGVDCVRERVKLVGLTLWLGRRPSRRCVRC